MSGISSELLQIEQYKWMVGQAKEIEAFHLKRQTDDESAEKIW